MTYQFLTVEMVRTAKTNGGFIDQKMFKTAGKYGFDSLFLTDTSMQVLDGYIDHIRPHLKPTCDYVLVTRNGGQHIKLGELMSKLVFDAIGKYVHPTRYRKIVETVSSKKLSSNAQGTISEDQEHRSVVARVHYQKQRSREIATKAEEYLETLYGEKGSALEMDVRSRLSDKSASSPEQEEIDDRLVPEEHNTLITPNNSKSKNASKTPDSLTGRKILLFNSEDDQYLRMGLERHVFGNWTAILRDPDFHFQKGRKSNSLLNRATRKFKKY